MPGTPRTDQPLSRASQYGPLAGSNGVTANRIPAIAAAHSAQVGEAEKIKRIRLALPVVLAVAAGKAEALGQAWMKGISSELARKILRERPT